MAHELMHVKHRDILIGSVAAAIATAISFIAQMAMYSSMFGGRDRRSGNPIGMLAMALLAPIAASLIQMAVSRSREFEADRGAAELLGSGESLARALEKIEVIAHQRPMAVAPAQAQAYIHNPLAEARSAVAVEAPTWPSCSAPTPPPTSGSAACGRSEIQAFLGSSENGVVRSKPGSFGRPSTRSPMMLRWT